MCPMARYASSIRVTFARNIISCWLNPVPCTPRDSSSTFTGVRDFGCAAPSSKPSKNDDHVGSTERGLSFHCWYLSSSRSTLRRAEMEEGMGWKSSSGFQPEVLMGTTANRQPESSHSAAEFTWQPFREAGRRIHCITAKSPRPSGHVRHPCATPNGSPLCRPGPCGGSDQGTLFFIPQRHES